MRKILLIFVLITSFTTLNSCKKDSNGNVVIPSMSAKINLADWSSLVRTATITGNTLSVNGSSLGGEIIQLTVTPDNNATLATNVSYTISVTSFYKKSINASLEDAYFALSGTVKLTQLDLTNKLISGTFNFSASSTNFGLAAITNGEFTNISFTAL